MIQTDYFLDKPTYIKISLTNLCNFRCIMCYYSTLKQEKGFISDDLLFKIFQDCKNLGINRVALGGVGEPLLHKNYIKYLKVAKSLGFWTSTATNCSLLNKEIAESIIREKLDRLNLSIYSSSTSEHKRYTGTDTFDQVVENIKYFLELWRNSGRQTWVKLNFLQIPGVNEHKRFAEFWRPIARKAGLIISLKRPINWGSRVNFYRSKPFFVYRHRQPCPHVRYYLHVLHSGEILPCCNIPEGSGCQEIVFGDLRKDSIMNIWQNQRYLEFKKSHYNKKAANYRPCRDCSDAFCDYNLAQLLKRLACTLPKK